MVLNILSVIALILSLGGNLLVNFKRKTGFIIWSISNIFWIIVNFIGVPNVSQIIMYVIYFGLNIHGFINWKNKEKIEKSIKAYLLQ